jgi:AraC family transcriptional regulator of adaptative response/methylated-DNA-[protein]-cysteine methyltransferase
VSSARRSSYVEYSANGGALEIGPASYGPGGRGAQIRFTIIDSPLGRLLVAGTNNGVCAVSLGNSDAVLKAELSGDYPAAEIRRDDAAIRPWARAIVDYLDGLNRDLNLPLDVRATPFQLRVWKRLCAIPCGKTSSYKQLAEALGNPKAARAVGSAVGANPVAILIPCHRAIREGGGLGGYRWGLDRKRALLDRERSRAS